MQDRKNKKKEDKEKWSKLQGKQTHTDQMYWLATPHS